MAIIHPETFYQWLLEMRRLKLRLSPLGGLGEALTHHALDPKNPNIAYGFWDHQAARGFIDVDNRLFMAERKGARWDVLKQQ
jgi:hypothetical protein